MKKIYTLLAAVTIVSSGLAAPLTPQDAFRRAMDSSDAPARIKDASAAPQLVMTGTSADGAAAYYVFSDASKTLFVAADDVARPLLGYSDSGNFSSDAMPPQLEWWLSEYAAEIEYAKSHPVLHTQSPEKAPANTTAIAPMVTTIWNQTSPFNKYCPLKNGYRTVTGCVATSMAQVMNYYKWPEAEVEPISYEWNGQTLTSPATVIDWANMLDSYNGHYTTAQADAVGRLMQLAGYSVKMQYDIESNGGSGAYSIDIRGALVENFGYDVATDYLQRTFYTTEEWEQIIYDNLANVGPVIYNGRGSAGGHSFVCDGYDNNGYFHINWGWGGMEDGYYALSALNPGQLGAGGGAGGFNYNQGAVVGIQKPQEGSVAPEPYLACDTSIEGSTSGHILTVGATDGGGIWNLGVMDGTFDLGVRLSNSETQNVYEYTARTAKLAPNQGFYSYNVTIPASLPYGTYEVRPVYALNSGEWQYVRYAQDAIDRFNLVVSAAGISIEGGVGPGEINFVSWECTDGFTVGLAYDLNATVSSTYENDVDYTLRATLCTLNENTLYIKQDLGTVTATVPAKSTAVLNYTGSISSTFEAGSYYLAFLQGNSIVKYAVVEVKTADEGEIYLTSWEGTDELQVGAPYESHLVVTSTYNHAVQYDLDMYLCVFANNQYSIVADFGNVSVNVPANSQATMSWTGTTPDVIPGDYYLVFAKDYMVQGSVEVTVISAQGLVCDGFELTPEELETGKDSQVKVKVENHSSREESAELSLHLCVINDNNSLQSKHTYGIANMTIAPESQEELTFTTVIPKDLQGDEYYLALVYNDSKILDYIPVVLHISVGVDSIPDADETECRYFNLQGVEVDGRNLAPGLYIRYQGEKSSTVLVK